MSPLLEASATERTSRPAAAACRDWRNLREGRLRRSHPNPSGSGAWAWPWEPNPRIATVLPRASRGRRPCREDVLGAHDPDAMGYPLPGAAP